MREYEKRKTEHITLALKSKNQAQDTGLSQVHLIHEALPELDWNQIDISTNILNQKRPTPFFVSGMTGGTTEAFEINHRLAQACERRGWMMGVGSQRRQLMELKAHKEWEELRAKNPKLCLMGNLGLSQLIQISPKQVEEMVHALQASAMVIHTNALQECIQPEGTPQFKGGRQALENLVQNLSVPVCLKETGCGFSYKTLNTLNGIGLAAIDISGYGGTHWGRIETDRISTDSVSKDLVSDKKVGESFAHWGNSTLSSLLDAQKVENKDYSVWASGGIQNGLDAAKCLALGAQAVGSAQVMLKQAMQSEKKLDNQMFLFEQELKIALFCTGSQRIEDLQDKWSIKNDLRL